MVALGYIIVTFILIAVMILAMYGFGEYQDHQKFRNYERKVMSFQEFLDWYKQESMCWSLMLFYPVYIPNNQFYWSHTVIKFKSFKDRLIYASFRKKFISKLKTDHFYLLYKTDWVDEWKQSAFIKNLKLV